VIGGSKSDMARGVRARRMLGGAMRQAGILAAAGLYALEHNVSRLGEDHENARVIADRLAGLAAVMLDVATVQSNIVIFHMREGAPDAAAIARRAKEAGVLLSVFGQRKLRAVTHLDVSGEDCARAAEILFEVIARA
jgi:threonine aldolase